MTRRTRPWPSWTNGPPTGVRAASRCRWCDARSGRGTRRGRWRMAPRWPRASSTVCSTPTSSRHRISSPGPWAGLPIPRWAPCRGDGRTAIGSTAGSRGRRRWSSTPSSWWSRKRGIGQGSCCASTGRPASGAPPRWPMPAVGRRIRCQRTTTSVCGHSCVAGAWCTIATSWPRRSSPSRCTIIRCNRRDGRVGVGR